jgi:alpha-1,6-mannosyltransferase
VSVDDWAVVALAPDSQPLGAEVPSLPLRRAIARPATVGGVALAVLVACVFVLAAGAAAGPSDFVALSAKHFPSWMAGPLHGLGLEMPSGVLKALVVVICLCYALALLCATALGSRRVWCAIVLAHVAALLAPPLLSSDVFGYIAFARLGVLHGLSPYGHGASAAPHDAILPYVGWPNVTTPYGPLFTLISYAIVPLGIAGGLWALKLVAAFTSLATVALVWRIATRLGRSPSSAVVMYGLNPLVLVFAVAGAQNDTLIGMFVAAGLLLIVTARERAGGVALVLATALKASAGLVLPFALLGASRRRRVAVAMLAALVLAAIVAVVAFGSELSGLGQALVGEQRDVAVRSVPSYVSRLLGFGRLAEGIRVAFLTLFGAALLAALWRTWRGSWWIDCYAWATLALLACTGWLLPWYGLWALLPASLSASRRLQAVTLASCVYLLAIKIA